MYPALEVAVIGPLNVDLIVAGDAPRDIATLRHWLGLSEVTLTPAGAAGYPAQVFQKLGLQTGLLSIIADDPLGGLLRRGLSDTGIDISRLRVTQGELTQLAIYMLLFGDKKRPLTGRRSTHQPWPDPFDDDDIRYLASARLIHVAGYLHYPWMWNDQVPNLLRQSRANGQMTSLDPQFPLYSVEGRWLPGVERLLPYVDVLLLDQDEARNITGLDDLDKAVQMLAECGPSIVVVKCAADGSLIYHAGERIEQPAHVVGEDRVADVVGAGDAYDAGFLAALLRHRSLADAAKIGSAVAAISLQGHGAANAMTPNDTIERLIERCLGN
jgi:sugar/nucleoside kinase (ribokinase family)